MSDDPVSALVARLRRFLIWKGCTQAEVERLLALVEAGQALAAAGLRHDEQIVHCRFCASWIGTQTLASLLIGERWHALGCPLAVYARAVAALGETP